MMNQFTEVRVALWAETPGDLSAIEIALAPLGCRVSRAGSFAELGQWIMTQSVDLVVTWLSGEDQSALELVTWLDEIADSPPVLVVGSVLEMGLYLEAMRRGAFDCIELPVDGAELARIVGAASESSRVHQPA